MPLRYIDEIQTDRLRLRPVCSDDVPELLTINGDEEVTRFLPFATWRSLADGRAWLDRMHALCASGAAQQLVVIRATDSRPVGTLLLFRFDEASSRLELGYVIGRAYWRQGFARETLCAAIGHAFDHMHIRRFEAEVNPANLASNALLRSIGFQHEGLLRKRWVAKGVAYDVNAYGLLASEWNAGAA